MKLIVLGQPFCNEYNNKEAFIFIACGSDQSPTDHQGNPLAESKEFESYLLKNILPFLNRKQEVFLFTYQVDYPQGSSIPACILKRKDNSDITQNDLKNLKQQIEGLLNEYQSHLKRRENKLFTLVSATHEVHEAKKQASKLRR